MPVTEVAVAGVAAAARGAAVLLGAGYCWALATGHRDEMVYKLAILQIVAGWWFGCHQFYFPRHIGNFIIPIDELIFFRGVQTTNQYCISMYISYNNQ